MRQAVEISILFSTIVLIAAGLAVPAQTGSPRLDGGPLSFEDRVQCRRAIEEVYWRHRIWPAENPGPKPALEEVLSDAVIRERVTTYLQKSAALEILWQRPLTGEQMQAELDRMGRDTQNPALLRELFAALDDDPLLVAECLARPTLVDRLARDRYARDARFHDALRERIESALGTVSNDTTRLEELADAYGETEWRLVEGTAPVAALETETGEDRVVELNAAAWRERTRRFEAIPEGDCSPLTEENHRFTITEVLSRTSDRLRIATFTWSKRPFDKWFARVGREAAGRDVAIAPALPPLGEFELPSPRSHACDFDTWGATSTGVGVPEARSHHTAVWTGAEMIVWGGSYGSLYLNSGGKYDPATDSWTATSMGSDLPAGRSYHTAVWTGTEMIVWGGEDRLTSHASGGEYNPATDTWAAMPEGLDAPADRTYHTAVWTGTEMIVWGGARYRYMGISRQRTNMNSGGRYDPANRSWKAVSRGSGVPFARSYHTSIWTGTEMIVWGGGFWRRWNGFVGTNTGGRYDPTTDRWMETSTGTGVPGQKRHHVAVWTGTEMIVWGGSGYLGYENLGGRYDPLHDSWTATSTGTGVPSDRVDHSAVWTGTEMIIWGGRVFLPDGFDTGGLYDPATDTWKATSMEHGLPDGRWKHSTVWNGREMIVWGGIHPSIVDSGGRYCACEGKVVSTWYPDADGDGLGADSTGIPACEQPPGYIATGGDCDDRYAGCTSDCTDVDLDGLPACAPDCDDTNPNCTTNCTDADGDTYCVTHDCDESDPDTYPAAVEINDGLDNQCPDDPGHGLVDEITGDCGFHNPADANEFSCPLQAGATRYEVARSPHPEFPTQVGCLRIVSDAATWVDTDPAPEGTCFYYLVRSREPNVGSWGAYSMGFERTVTCHR